MTDDFVIYDPKRFFKVFVQRAFEEYSAAPLDHLRVKTLISNIDTLAERMWVWFKDRDPGKIANARSARSYREYLVENECSEFQIVWDMHDGHKHVELSRTNRRITSAAQSGVKREGDPIGSAPIGAMPIGGTIDSFVIRMDDRTEYELAPVIEAVIAMWERVLAAL